GAIKGAGEGAIRLLVDARKNIGGTITSIFALVEPLDLRLVNKTVAPGVVQLDLRLVNKKVLECLVKAGALDGLSASGSGSYLSWRPRLLAGLDRVLDHGGRLHKDRGEGQSRLFGGDEAVAEVPDDGASLPEARPWSETEALAFEKEALGLYMSGHPLQRYADVLAAAGARRLSELTQSEADCAIGGV